MRKVFSILLILLYINFCANAYDFMVNGLCYNYNSDGLSVTVTYQTTTNPRYPNLSGDINIPDNVTHNGRNYSVSAIGDHAFYGCNLTSVTIGNSVTDIGALSFSFCTSLINVIIPNSVTSIGERAFSACEKLTSVNIPNSVISLGIFAFSSCHDMTSVSIGNSVAIIGDNAFYGCENLTSISIPSSVTSIGKGALASCRKLTSMVVESGNSVYDSRNNCNAIIEKESNILIAGCVNTIIPNSVLSIGERAFYGCRNLTGMTIPNSVISIGESAFEVCTGLVNINIPNSIESIDKSAFKYCNSLTNIDLPHSVKSIGENAFYSCSNLTNITIPSSVVSIGRNAFQDTKWYNNQPDGLVYAGSVAYKYKGTMPSSLALDINVGTLGIADYCFVNCRNLITITIPNTIISIGNNAFTGCTGLTCIYNHINHPFDVVLGSEVFKNINYNNCILFVAQGRINQYKNAEQWKDFKNIVEGDWIIPVESINFSESSLTMNIGETSTLPILMIPEDPSIPLLNWQSSNPLVATINQDGIITAKMPGTSIITATTTDGTNLSTSCEVSVKGITAITLNKTSTSIYSGGTETLIAYITPSDVINNTLIWTSDNTNVATVDQNGTVIAKLVGSATITATTTDGTNLSASCFVTVTGINGISLNKTSANIYVGESEQLTVNITPNDVINKTLFWQSSNSNVATVDQNGLVTACNVGTTIISATTTDGTNISASCVITVIPPYDLYPTTTELTHVRGQSDFSAVIPFWMSNKTAISGLQFDITLPTGVSFATVDDYPDVWLDANRKARNHTVDVNLISGSKYRVLVSSPTNNTFKGNEGVVLYMRLNIDSAHPVGTYYINTSNVIFVEPDETQHIGYNKSVKIDYKYLLGDADGDARVDVADYTVTALYILNRPTETFYSDAANVNGDYNITVTDLVGITNISLGIRPHEYRPAPAIMMDNETQVSMPSLNASVEGDNIVALSIDNDTPLAGMQLDLQLPQGMTLADATLEGRAVNYQLSTNTLANGRVRLLISSFGDKDIEAGNDAVIKLVLEGDNVNNEMLYITGAQAASRDLRSYELNDVNLPVGTTSINDIGYSYDKLSIYGKGNTIIVNSPSAMTVQLVHVNGMVMPIEIKPGHNTIDVGGHGVYIIRVGNSAYKLRL